MADLELKYRDITCFDAVKDLTVTHEESMETAIPEYCPDLARIVDTSGQVRLRDKTLSDGKLTINGSIRVTVLYTSEESAGLRSLTLTLPFSCKVDDKQDCQMISVDSRLLLLEVKMLGARKLYIRALLEFRVRGYQKSSRRLCVAAEDESELQTRRQRAMMQLLTDIWEKEFSFSQEVPPEDNQREAEDLLMDRIHLSVTSCQHFGNKLVVKGEASLSLLCRGETNLLERRDMTLPFSQIIDGEDLPDSGDYYCTAQVMEHEIHPVRTENGNGFGVTVRICLLIQTYEQCAVDYLEDLYSTHFEMETMFETVAFPTLQQPEELRRDSSQRLEGAGAFAYLTDVDCTQPELTTSGNSLTTLCSTVHMKILYLDEAGTPVIAERSAEVSSELGQLPSSVQTRVEPAVWQRIGGGFEVRIPVLFRMNHAEQKEVTAVASARVLGEIDRTATPSLILRRMQEGETLWDVAKKCRTEEQAILAANGLEQEGDASDMMLLIPRVR